MQLQTSTKFFLNICVTQCLVYIENIRNRKNVYIVNSKDKVRKPVNKFNFLTFEILGTSSSIITMRKPNVLLNKPIYVGFSVLDLSKLSMAKFHYEKVGKWYEEKANFLFTDTDSFCYQIFTHDLYEDLIKHTKHFDLSEYPRDHFLNSNKNKKVLGKWKDELNGKLLLLVCRSLCKNVLNEWRRFFFAKSQRCEKKGCEKII